MTSIAEARSTTVLQARRFFSVEEAPLVRAGRVLGVVVVVAGVVARFYSPSALWLDETISVNVSRLSLTGIIHALAHDGSPPLYYFLLHFWMLPFGEGDVAVRTLSGLLSVAALPFFWAAGMRLGGRRTAWATLLLAASSPFAIYYATETRMYSLMVLLSVLGFLAMARVLEQPTRPRAVALGAVTAAILYTHYWGLYLVGSAGLWLLYRIWRSTHRPGTETEVTARAVRAAFGAMVIGTVCWLPAAPLFVWQTLHTGTPWTGAAGPADVLAIFSQFAGTGPWGQLLMFWLFALVIFGLFGMPVHRVGSPGSLSAAGAPARYRIVLDLRTRVEARPVAVVLAGTLAAAVVGGAIANAAFVARYTAVVFPLFVLLAALGLTVFADRRIVSGLLGMACVAGVLTGLSNNGEQRTQAAQVAAVLNVQAQSGDEVVYCPDQLAPAVDRLLTVPDVTQLTFPRAVGPVLVDWVDYRQVIDHTDVGSFAQEMLSRLSSGHTLWLVYRNGYPGLGGDCGYLDSWLNLLRPTGETVVTQNNGKYLEYENLVRFPS
ncbi:MAG TPA: glycosyltransferase family 39 protein [Acidimicrobiales bacterium]|nr:glycosyltransferase family 39 protein [Acidimicrobiales bacterium]